MNIIIYTKTGCPWCKGALEFLRNKKLDFEERNVTENKDFFKEMIEKSGQEKAPTLDIDGEILADSSAEEIAVYFQKKGFGGQEKNSSSGGGKNTCDVEL